MTDKFIDPKTRKELFRIKDDNSVLKTEEGKLSFLLKDVEYWEKQLEISPTKFTKESLSLAQKRLKTFQESQ